MGRITSIKDKALTALSSLRRYTGRPEATVPNSSEELEYVATQVFRPPAEENAGAEKEPAQSLQESFAW